MVPLKRINPWNFSSVNEFFLIKSSRDLSTQTKKRFILKKPNMLSARTRKTTQSVYCGGRMFYILGLVHVFCPLLSRCQVFTLKEAGSI